jgi:hypothetical protein
VWKRHQQTEQECTAAAGVASWFQCMCMSRRRQQQRLQQLQASCCCTC